MDVLEQIKKYIEDNFPQYKDYEIEVLANEYDITEGLERIVEEVETWCENNDCYHPQLIELAGYAGDLNESITRVEPPEGYIYVTVVKNGHRIGLNVPRSVV